MILMQIGAHGPRDKGMKCSTVGVKRSTIKKEKRKCIYIVLFL